MITILGMLAWYKAGEDSQYVPLYFLSLVITDIILIGTIGELLIFFGD